VKARHSVSSCSKEKEGKKENSILAQLQLINNNNNNKNIFRDQ
jgi:hypothetical protein